MSAKATTPNLTSGRLLARNTVWNLLGTTVPTAAALLCIPPLTRALGSSRFGLLALAWALVGYASLFDLGLGRALTQLVARRLGTDGEKNVCALVWTCLLLMSLLGTIGAFVTWFASSWLIERALNIPVILQPEALSAFHLLGLSIPFVITTAGLRGVLEANQRFPLINALRVPMGLLMFLAPLAVLPFSHSAVAVVGALVLSRCIGWLAHLIACLSVLPNLRQGLIWSETEVVPLLRFGSWMTVTNIVGPLMVTLDRFVIGGLVTIAAVAYYATPFEVVTKLWLIPAALTSVVFPAFSTDIDRNRNRTSLLFDRSVKVLLLTLLPVILLMMAFSHDALRLWLGNEFANNSYRVMQWLCVGVFLNSLAQVPFILIQGAGLPNKTAKLHLLELPLYLGALWLLVKTHGIEGAAIAWTARCAFDALAMFLLAKPLLADSDLMKRRQIWIVAAVLFAFVCALLPASLILKTALSLGTIAGFLCLSWIILLTPRDRLIVQRRLAVNNGD